MPMTKKDFKAIADALRGPTENPAITHRERTMLTIVARAIASHCKRSNPNFAADTFMEAANALPKDQY